ncbi:hypothetical protein FisN_15Hh290 [Fistulifera solaris]|uniref:Uncharacterized protein n=1 Tax=Fistulifera solaris TaxID=1519565 RepID=A0A1Z5JGC5_FISSO|nr:hypothetical protein FisN_15Hh290 [Fistulifera solaris]|eukprot:GAX12811.1 hypothetical protein FisN_15Hh290 [Fistulifera solaris]
MIRSLLFSSLLVTMTAAWTMTGTAVSGFHGAVVMSRMPSSSSSTLQMKKGKSNVPIQMRGQYKKAQELSQMRQEMIAASQAGDDGLPVFNLFVRTKRGNMWYPCGSFKGDDRSAALTKSWADNGLLAGISKKQLDGGIAGSLYRDLDKLKETILRAFPQLRKSKDELEFGYKLSFKGLDEEKAKEIFVVEPKENKGVLDNIKDIFSG